MLPCLICVRNSSAKRPRIDCSTCDRTFLARSAFASGVPPDALTVTLLDRFMIGALVCDVAEMRDGKEIGIAPTSPPLAKLLSEPELIASSIARCLPVASALMTNSPLLNLAGTLSLVPLPGPRTMPPLANPNKLLNSDPELLLLAPPPPMAAPPPENRLLKIPSIAMSASCDARLARAFCRASVAPSRCYMLVDGANGGVTDPAHGGWFDVVDFSMAAARGVLGNSGSGAQATGPELATITVALADSHALTALFAGMASGTQAGWRRHRRHLESGCRKSRL